MNSGATNKAGIIWISQLAVESREKTHVLVHADDDALIFRQFGQAPQQPARQRNLPTRQGHGVRVILQVNQPGAEIRLLVQLVEIQPQLGAAQPDGAIGAQARVQHGHGHQQRADLPEHPRKRQDR